MANQATNTTLKTVSHSRYGDAGILTSPYYNKTDGWAVLSAANHMVLPFTDNWFKPSITYQCSFAHRLAAFVTDGAITATDATFTSATAVFTAGDAGRAITVEGAGVAAADLVTTIASYTNATTVELTATASTTVSGAYTTFGVDAWDSAAQPELESGLWDNAAGQRKWLEGTALVLVGSVVGTPGATTSRDYMVEVKDDWNQTMSTNTITVAGAPADGSFNATTYVLLQFTRVVGAVNYAVYRKTGATYHLLANVYPNTSYQDRGTTIKTVGGYPATEYPYQRAYRRLTPSQFTPTDQWGRSQFTIDVPYDYNKSVTTNKQWFRMGLTGQLVGAGLKLEVDRISIDAKRGFYTPCPLDFLAKRSVASAPTTSTQGNTNTGGGGVVLPPWRDQPEIVP